MHALIQGPVAVEISWNVLPGFPLAFYSSDCCKRVITFKRIELQKGFPFSRQKLFECIAMPGPSASANGLSAVQGTWAFHTIKNNKQTKIKIENRKWPCTPKYLFYFKKRKGWTSMCGIVSVGWLEGGKIEHIVSGKPKSDTVGFILECKVIPNRQ